MRNLIHLIIFSLLINILSGCSAGRTAFSKGETFEAQGNYEDAMYSYAEAFRKEPEAGEYRAKFFKTRILAAENRFKMGIEQYDRGDYVGALAEFQTAYGIDLTQGRFKQKADEVVRLRDGQLAYQEGRDFEKANKLKDAQRAYAAAVELHPENKEYKAALNRILGLRKSKLEGFELSLKSSKPITLKFKDARIKDVFTIITQLTGINFVFDEGVKDQPISIYLENATFQQALDLLTNMNKLRTKILNESTVIIYPKSPEKDKQYDDLTVRTFHLGYMDAKKAVNLIRTMLQVKKIHVNEESNSLIVRDTPEVVEVVEKIIDANDVPDPEVVLEVEVMEITDKNAQNLGLLLSSYNVQLGAFKGATPLSGSLSTVTTVPATGTGGTVTEAAKIDNLIKAFSVGGYSGFLTVPSAQYNFGKTITKGEVLSNPKIRVKNKEKAKFNVGQRVPITTTTLNGTLSQVNVQYVDVGVKLNAEPNIQLNNEIIIKLSLEVSSILSKEVVGGSSSPTSVVTIGTRNLDTVLSLKDGETSIIGGLIQNTQNNTEQKIYLLSDIPLIGPLLTNHDKTKDKTELVLAITPRLVRSVTVPQSSLMNFGSGKEDDPTLQKPMASFDQEPVYDAPAKTESKKSTKTSKSSTVPEKSAPSKPSAPKTEPVKPASGVSESVRPEQGTPAKVQEGAPAKPALKPAADPVKSPSAATSTPVGQPSEGTAVASVPPTPVTPVPILPAPPKAVSASTPARGLIQLAAPATISLGQQFYVDVKLADIQDLVNGTFAMTFNPIFVEFVSAAEGTFMKRDGKPATFSATPSNGQLSVTIARGAIVGGISGNGTIASVLFRAKNKGPASFGFRSVAFTNSEGATQEILPFSTSVDVR